MDPRDGYLLCFNREAKIPRYTYDLLDKQCLRHGLGSHHRTSDLKADRGLALDDILTHVDLKGDQKPADYQLGHSSPFLFHVHNEKEMEAANLMSNVFWNIKT